MKRISDLKAMHEQSIEAVFRLLLGSSSPVSRAGLAQKTGLSLMTIGKISDTLIKSGACTESRSEEIKSGRSASMLSVNSQLFTAVISMYQPFSMSVVYPAENYRTVTIAAENASADADSAVDYFISELFGSYDIDCLCGIAFILPDRAAEDTLKNRIGEMLPSMTVESFTPAEAVSSSGTAAFHLSGQSFSAYFKNMCFDISSLRTESGEKISQCRLNAQNIAVLRGDIAVLTGCADVRFSVSDADKVSGDISELHGLIKTDECIKCAADRIMLAYIKEISKQQ